MIFKCLLFLFLESFAHAAKILFIPAHTFDSHAKSMLPLAEALAENGHKVAMWFPAAKDAPKILSTNRVEIWQTVFQSALNEDDAVPSVNEDDENTLKLFWSMKGLPTLSMAFLWQAAWQPCYAAINQNFSDIQKLMDEKWDIFFTDNVFVPCAYLFGHLSSNTSRIPFSTSFLWSLSANSRGTPTHKGPYAEWIQFEFDHRNFKDRFFEVLKYSITYLTIKFVEKYMAFLYFSDILPPNFRIVDFEGEGLLLASVLPTILDLPRPLTLDTISVGDLKCKYSAKSLSDDYLDFVEDPASKGTIIAAFGHSIGWKVAPETVLQAYWGAFAKLSDYRIVWQYDGPLLKNLSHVKIVHWLPQTDLLIHSKTKAFISHCGAKSLAEAICAKVPILGFPIFGDQMRNAHLVVHHKIGTKMNKFSMTTDYAYNLLVDVLEKNHEVYKKNVKKFAEMIQDQPIRGTWRGIFSVERALKKNDPALFYQKVKGATLDNFTYFCLEVLFFCVFIAFFSIISIVK